MHKLKEYKGGAGPSTEQARNNTLWLADQLKARGLECRVLPLSKAPDMDPGDVGNDSFVVRFKKYWMDYDRWGFVVSRNRELVHDQISGKALLEWIDKYNKR